MSDHDSSLLSPQVSWTLVFAHPGHELRAHRLLEIVRPSVVVLTDGAGSTAEPRLDDSLALLADAGARPASMFGVLSDREAYAALMASDPTPFVECLNVLADTFISESVRAVLVDAAEGYNPVHDVCHWIGCAAVTRARAFGARIDLFEVDLVSHPDSMGNVRVELDDAAFARKMDAATRYAALKSEADAAFERYGRDAFRVEVLRRVTDRSAPPAAYVPYYEKVGEERVREGRYQSVLRYGSHVKPVIDTILTSAGAARHASNLSPLHE